MEKQFQRSSVKFTAAQQFQLSFALQLLTAKNFQESLSIKLDYFCLASKTAFNQAISFDLTLIICILRFPLKSCFLHIPNNRKSRSKCPHLACFTYDDLPGLKSNIQPQRTGCMGRSAGVSADFHRAVQLLQLIDDIIKLRAAHGSNGTA